MIAVSDGSKCSRGTSGHFARLRFQPSFVTARAHIEPLRRALLAAHTANLIRLRLRQHIERLFENQIEATASNVRTLCYVTPQQPLLIRPNTARREYGSALRRSALGSEQ